MLKNIIVKAIVLCSLAFLVACGDDADAFLPACGDDDGDSATYSDASSSSVKSSSSEKASSSSEGAKSSSSVAPEQSSSSLTPKQSSSSSSPKQSSSSITPEQLSSDSEWTGAYFTDPRDGRAYKVVVMGSQVWMAENLKYETEGSYCYDDNASNCERYGRLYLWSAAMDSAGTWSTQGLDCGYGKKCSLYTKVQGVCPDGWHLPDSTEFNALYTVVGGSIIAGKKLKSSNGWENDGNGDDLFGFSVLPAGYRNYVGEYVNQGSDAYIWSANERDFYDAFYVIVRNSKDNVYGDMLYYHKYNAFSVRCVRNEPVDPPPDYNQCDYGSLTDSRDGQTYKTTVIGSQTWMAENLNYEVDDSYCFADKVSYCDMYGRLYTWSAALSACPSGWHLPTKAEFETLSMAVGDSIIAGQLLMSTSGWYQDLPYDMYDHCFAALPAGFKYNPEVDVDYEGISSITMFWSSTEFSSENAYNMRLRYRSGKAFLDMDERKTRAFSVRCVMD